MERLIAHCETQTTEMLYAVVRELNLKTDTAEIMACVAATRVLETRLTEADFLTLMNELEAELMAA